MKVLVVNVFFDPYTFGGATIVAENMAEQLHGEHGFAVTALSGRYDRLPCPSIVRYRTKYGHEAFSVGLPHPETYEQKFKNPSFVPPFIDVLDHVRPDVIHVHCIQNLGAGFFDAIVERGIPFVVTVHDFWWLCERQFMLDTQNKFCDQRKIDVRICAVCSGEETRVRRRLNYLLAQLEKANLVLTPSNFARQLLIDNGLRPEKVIVNKNGVRSPSPTQGTAGRPQPSNLTTFGYIGGPGVLKGWDLIAEAFRALPPETARLVVVDAGEAIGQSWRPEFERYKNELPIEIIPAYGPDDLDRVFAELDVILCPSQWKETFGLVAREALIRDVWVIASDAGGLAEDIVDGKNGDVLPFPPTSRALAAAISRRIGTPRAPLPFKDRVARLQDQACELASLLREARNDTRVDLSYA